MIAESAGGRPLIGITPDEIKNADTGSQNEGQTCFYSKAIRDAGGLATILTVEDDPDYIDDLLARQQYDGLLLSGGLDVNSSIYGESSLPTDRPGSEANDKMTLQLIRRAKAANIPVLAICRGLQLLNIAEGGSLHRHLPDISDGIIEHRRLSPGSHDMHQVSLDADCNLSRAILPDAGDHTTIWVNTRHHQAIDRLGNNLRVTGRAPDGVIEAIESTRRGWYAVGTQWHAEECMPAFAPLFASFVEVCRDPVKRFMTEPERVAA